MFGGDYSVSNLGENSSLVQEKLILCCMIFFPVVSVILLEREIKGGLLDPYFFSNVNFVRSKVHTNVRFVSSTTLIVTDLMQLLYVMQSKLILPEKLCPENVTNLGLSSKTVGLLWTALDKPGQLLSPVMCAMLHASLMVASFSCSLHIFIKQWNRSEEVQCLFWTYVVLATLFLSPSRVFFNFEMGYFKHGIRSDLH